VVSGDVGAITEGSPATRTDAGSFTFDGEPVLGEPSIASAVSITPSAGLTLSAAQAAAFKAGLAVSRLDNGTNPDAIAWTYSLAESDLDFLRPGQSVTLGYTVNTAGASSTLAQPVTIVVVGTNDVPTLAAIAAPAAVAELNAAAT
jgi:VCBS repeat-containing protein